MHFSQYKLNVQKENRGCALDMKSYLDSQSLSYTFMATNTGQGSDVKYVLAISEFQKVNQT